MDSKKPISLCGSLSQTACSHASLRSQPRRPAAALQQGFPADSEGTVGTAGSPGGTSFEWLRADQSYEENQFLSDC